ncbi:hypothetical protein [Croceivirga radicis]|nr:hypothetical protein [Croceivirga radicis]
MEQIEFLKSDELIEINGGLLNPAPGANLTGIVKLGVAFVKGIFSGTDIF